MTIEEYEKMVAPLTVDADTRFCMEYLERIGLRFCCDFGYENAKEIAAREARKRLCISA